MRTTLSACLRLHTTLLTAAPLLFSPLSGCAFLLSPLGIAPTVVFDSCRISARILTESSLLCFAVPLKLCLFRSPLTARFRLAPLSLYLRGTLTRLDFTTQLILLTLSLLLSRRNLGLFALKLRRTLRLSLCFRRRFALLTFGLGC